MAAAEQARARITLLSKAGLSGKEIDKRVGVTTQTVSKWRSRFEQDGIAGLTDSLRSGRPRSIIDEKVAEVIEKTLQIKPTTATRWSTTSIAEETELNPMTISHIWQAFGSKPHRLDTFKLSMDPRFVDKIHDIVDL